MEKELVLWDFDNTLFSTDPPHVYLYMKLYNRNISFGEAYIELKSLGERKLIDLSRELLELKNFQEIQPVSWVMDVVKELSPNYRQQVLTARPNCQDEYIAPLLDKHFSPYIQKINYLGSLDPKTDLAFNKLEGLVLIDDRMESFGGIEKSSGFGILYDPNHEYKRIDNPRIFIASDMREIPNIIKYLPRMS